jgi:hypothetical protein
MEQKIEYRTTVQPPQFHTITVTLAEHQLLKRIRQLANLAGTSRHAIILMLEIVSREQIGELAAGRKM